MKTKIALIALAACAALIGQAAATNWNAATAAPVVAETLLADGTTNTWTQADLVAALGLLNRRYRRDIKTSAGRRAWHGAEVGQALLTNDAGRIFMRRTYADGFTYDDAARRLTVQHIASNMAARVRASLPTNGVSPRVASLRARAADTPENVEITVKVNATHDYPAKVMQHETCQHDDYGVVTNRVPNGRTEFWIEAGGRIRCVRYDATNGVVKTYYRQRPTTATPAPRGESINTAAKKEAAK